jgi:chemotaxis protein methyltransferase CheR
LTVGETYFFRESHALELAAMHLIAKASDSPNRPIRVWSVGCATGEEPYSLAIMLNRLIQPWGASAITILATDIDLRSLEQAAKGVYSAWSFRNPPEWLIGDYFSPVSDRYWVISPDIKNKVTYRYLNLAEDFPNIWWEMASVDVILCRNVLMYLTANIRESAVRRLYRLLNDDGWLIVGVAETPLVPFPGFNCLVDGGVTIYRKNSHSRHSKGTICDDAEREIAASSPTPSEGPSTGEVFTLGKNEHRDQSRQDSAYEQAMIFYQRGSYEDAEQIAQSLLKIDSNNTQVILLLARIYANVGRLPEALSCCDTALARDRMATTAYYLRALILEELGALEEAALALKGAIHTDPKFVLGYFSLGNLALRLSSLGQPRKYFENALSLLVHYRSDELVPESNGLVAGDLRNVIHQCTRQLGQLIHLQDISGPRSPIRGRY